LAVQVPVTFIYGEHDWMNPSAGVAVAEILDKVRERKVRVSAAVGVGRVLRSEGRTGRVMECERGRW
jgi:hypothetical protein